MQDTVDQELVDTVLHSLLGNNAPATNVAEPGSTA